MSGGLQVAGRGSAAGRQTPTVSVSSASGSRAAFFEGSRKVPRSLFLWQNKALTPASRSVTRRGP